MTASVTRDAATPDQAVGLPTLTLGAITLIACAFAFVGLSAEGYWTDELFTLFLVNHHGGLAEVWRRALTDTHPPLYYFLLYGWAQVFGQSETALRSLSALFCVGAVAVFVAGTRGVFSLSGRLFAAAIAATSPFWFLQSQNVRNYALCLLVSSILTVLAIRARTCVRQDKPIPPLTVAGLCLFGAAGAFTHFYVFLAVGLLYLFLIVTVPSTRLRIALLVSGAAIFVGELAYMRLLLHATQQNTHAMWFRADAGFFANETLQAVEGLVGPGALIGLIALALAVLWPGGRGVTRATSPISDGAWSVWLGISVVAGLIAAGIAISLIFAPSYSNMNVLAASPVLWPALAAAFDAAAARAKGGWRWVAVGV
ncbi:MAG TPA: glycosyltransferase family 39 protein, partial [Caulobacteraceae bacterium]